LSEAIERRPGFYSRHRPELAAALGYLLLSCFYAWRVVWNFTSHLAGHGGDGWQNVWNMWWFKKALLSLQNPYFTDMLHHPDGHTLLFHTLNPFNCALALPFDLVFGQPVAYNIIFIFSFAASGFTMYLLVRELFGCRAGAFLAGCVFTFSHFHFAHAQGHMQLAAMEWLPLFVFFMVRTWRTKSLRDGIMMGVSLALCAFCAIYYFMAGVLIAFLAATVELVRQPRRVLEKKLLVSTGAGAAVFLVTGGVLLLAMLIQYFELDLVPAHDARYWSTDLQAFFIPPWVSAYGPAFISIWREWTGNSAECNQYLGYSVIVLTVMAFVLGKKGSRPLAWAGLALFGMILSLGPVLHWGGTIHDEIPLPYGLLEVVFPFLKMSGAPVRWHVITVLASAVLAGAGLSPVIERFSNSRIWKLDAGKVVAFSACLLVLAELLPHWVESRPFVHPAFIENIEKAPAEWAVYDLGDANEALLRQTGHGHKMIGGYVSRSTRQALDFIKNTPILRALRGVQFMPIDKIAQDARSLDLKLVIVPFNHRAVRRYPAMGLMKRWSQWGLDVWEVPWEYVPDAGEDD